MPPASTRFAILLLPGRSCPRNRPIFIPSFSAALPSMLLSRRNGRAIVCTGVLLCCALLASVAEPEKRLTVYTQQSGYSVPVMDRGGQSYIGIMELIQPLGATKAVVNGKQWKTRINQAEFQFTEGEEKALIRGNNIDLGGKVLVEDGRALVPLGSSFAILSSLFNKLVEYHPTARRIFVNNAATRFTAELKKGDRTSLLLAFSQPVNPEVVQEGNRIKLLFRREPVV